jgi:branched-chain amino acid transport system permease protein
VLALLAVAVSNLRRSGTGRRFLAVRANERAAAAAGIKVQRNKLLAFAVASAVAGVAGVMTAFQQQQISSANWTFFLGLGFLAFAYLGGITSVNGALIGGLLAPSGLLTVFGNHHNPGLNDYTSILGGVGMIVTAIQNPGGLALVLQPQLRYLGSWLKAARGPEWVTAIRRVLPGAIVGMIPVALLLYFRTRDFRNWYIPMTVLLGLFLRAVGLQFWAGVNAKRTERQAHAALAAEAAAATSATNLGDDENVAVRASAQ